MGMPQLEQLANQLLHEEHSACVQERQLWVQSVIAWKVDLNGIPASRTGYQVCDHILCAVAWKYCSTSPRKCEDLHNAKPTQLSQLSGHLP